MGLREREQCGGKKEVGLGLKKGWKLGVRVEGTRNNLERG
jgi:hypothetical protein